MTEFKAFPKLTRMGKECFVITEKLDGTNAQIVINGDEIRAGSRNKWITPDDDNYGFARWVEANRGELLKLGDGQHFGEWWGNGIQRGYGLKEKRFSLFNVRRWGAMYAAHLDGHETDFPKCCHVVPQLAVTSFDRSAVREILMKLLSSGSVAAPGFPAPEGVVAFHPRSNALYKMTERDEPKGKQE